MTTDLQKAIAAFDDDTLLRRLEQCELLRKRPEYRDSLKNFAKGVGRNMTNDRINLALLALEPALLVEKKKRNL